MTTTDLNPTPTTSPDALLDALVARYPAPPLYREPTAWEEVCWGVIRGGLPPVGTPHAELRGVVRELWARAAAGLITAAAVGAPVLLLSLASGR